MNDVLILLLTSLIKVILNKTDANNVFYIRNNYCMITSVTETDVTITKLNKTTLG